MTLGASQDHADRRNHGAAERHLDERARQRDVHEAAPDERDQEQLDGHDDVGDGEVTIAGPGESVDVARGAAHRLANEGAEELVIVEVQRGAYTGEDDIERLEDDYGRCEPASEAASGH